MIIYIYIYIYFFFSNSLFKKVKVLNKNVVARIINSEYKVVLLNNKCLRYSMNRIQWNLYEIDKIFLSCFDDKIYTLNNEYYRFALGY